MKKLCILMIFLLIPIVYSEINDNDVKKIDAVVRSRISEENQKLRADLNQDINEVKEETLSIIEQAKKSQTKDSIFFVLTIASSIIIAETLISFLKFQVYKRKKKIDIKVDKKELKKPEKLDKKDIKKDNGILKRKNKEIDDLKKKYKNMEKDFKFLLKKR